jgi:tetratricopeptide (TPR) repeat protein
MNLFLRPQSRIARTAPVHSDCRRKNLFALCGLALLVACAGVPVDSGEKKSPAPPIPRPVAAPAKKASDIAAELRLKEGVDQYDLGEFDNAIRLLTDSREISDGAPATRIQAYKYLAFSYCVQNRITLCRLNFDRALALDPQFELLPAERGHPQWGPVFEKAKHHEGPSPKDILKSLTAPK